jgi:hypothetical protein
MPRTRTLAQLRTEARQYADMESSAFVSDAEVDRYVNQGLAELWHVLVQADMDRYLSSTEIATTAGTYEYTVPADFASARTLERRESSGSERTYRLEPYNVSDGHSAEQYSEVCTHGLRWTILYQGTDGTATRLRFNADPGGGFFRLWYVQAPEVLTDDADVWDGVAGWEEWAVLWAAEQMLAKEESDPSALIRRRSELTQRVQQVAGSRIIGTAPSPARVRNRRRGWWL